jgi:hypothetical protein
MYITVTRGAITSPYYNLLSYRVWGGTPKKTIKLNLHPPSHNKLNKTAEQIFKKIYVGKFY